MNKILDGKKISQTIYEELKKKTAQIQGRKPGVAFILIGEDEGSMAYVRMKKKRCEEVGFFSETIKLESCVSEKELLFYIDRLNKATNIDGILVQQPLPSAISSKKVIEAVDPRKDVDGFHPLNLGKALLGYHDGFLSCTPFGIIKLLQAYNIETESKHIVILGRSNIVGKPMGSLLLQKGSFGNATVTTLHSKSKNINQIASTADIIIAAIGKPLFVKKEMVKKNAIVIDVGINRVNGKLVGDVDFDDVYDKVSAITPVPGGVGPMTIATLLQNTFDSFSKA